VGGRGWLFVGDHTKDVVVGILTIAVRW
jgi:hypothetical protein